MPSQLPADALAHLPEGPGVYRFYGLNPLPLYIGKSINLRERIAAHFSSDYRSANDLRLSAEITRIEIEETAGELGALLRESHLIKTLLPVYNHRLRRRRDHTTEHEHNRQPGGERSHQSSYVHVAPRAPPAI